MLQDELYAVMTQAAMAIVKENFRLWNANAHALNYQVYPPVTSASLVKALQVLLQKCADVVAVQEFERRLTHGVVPAGERGHFVIQA